jgi:hypothetical protein
VHDLRQSEAVLQEIVPVLDGTPSDVRIGRASTAQHISELIEEHWNPTRSGPFRPRRHRSCCDLRLAASDDFVAVGGNELVKHLALRAVSAYARATEHHVPNSTHPVQARHFFCVAAYR